MLDCYSIEVQIQFNRTKSPLELIVNTLRGELFTRSKSQSSECTPRHSHFGEASSRDFLGIFRKLEVKATNCHAFHCSIRSELDGVTATQRVEPTAAVKLRSPVTMGPLSRGRNVVGCKKRGEKSGKHRRRVACVFHSIWYFFHNAYAVHFFVTVTCTCHRRPFSAPWTFNPHRTFVP